MKYLTAFFSLFFLLTINLSAQDFEHNMDKSKELAQEEDKNILMIFCGSDWCKPCIQLRTEILTNPAFQEYSEDKLVLLELDFPYKKKNQLPDEQKAHNAQLADRFNKDGVFPKVILLAADERVIGEIDYQKSMTPDQFIDKINALK